jgi:EAL domain-containing protein (putative c-di-GMP-specific phosphodiesterase class I)
MVLSLLHKHNIDSSHLVLEVTETAMMHDPELALSVLHDLSNLGVRLSIDDFGTGHSSLAYIKRLPVQEIKIDRSFVMEMNHSKDDNIIVKTTVNMCHDLGLEVVAEGVETLDIQTSLEAMGCDYIQGYGLSHPLPFDELVPWIQDNLKS